jgi:hypothetical protein
MTDYRALWATIYFVTRFKGLCGLLATFQGCAYTFAMGACAGLLRIFAEGQSKKILKYRYFKRLPAFS